MVGLARTSRPEVVLEDIMCNNACERTLQGRLRYPSIKVCALTVQLRIARYAAVCFLSWSVWVVVGICACLPGKISQQFKKACRRLHITICPKICQQRCQRCCQRRPSCWPPRSLARTLWMNEWHIEIAGSCLLTHSCVDVTQPTQLPAQPPPQLHA